MIQEFGRHFLADVFVPTMQTPMWILFPGLSLDLLARGVFAALEMMRSLLQRSLCDTCIALSIATL